MARPSGANPAHSRRCPLPRQTTRLVPACQSPSPGRKRLGPRRRWLGHTPPDPGGAADCFHHHELLSRKRVCEGCPRRVDWRNFLSCQPRRSHRRPMRRRVNLAAIPRAFCGRVLDLAPNGRSRARANWRGIRDPGHAMRHHEAVGGARPRHPEGGMISTNRRQPPVGVGSTTGGQVATWPAVLWGSSEVSDRRPSQR